MTAGEQIQSGKSNENFNLLSIKPLKRLRSVGE